MPRASRKLRLRISSVQHLARTWRPTPEATAGELVKLVLNSPVFSYAPLYEISKSLLLRQTSYSQAVECVDRIRRANVRDIYHSVLPLINAHFSAAEVSFVHNVVPRSFAIGQSLFVPFNPIMLYGTGKEIVIPWLSMWKTNPVVGRKLALFATIVEEVLRDDAELDEARLEIVDLSAPAGTKDRVLRVTQLRDIPLLENAEVVEMLSIFSKGYQIAEAAIKRIKEEGMELDRIIEDSSQLRLDFDGRLT